MSIRDAIIAISPIWLTDKVAGGVQYAEGMVLDAIDTWTKEGIKARFPGVSTMDSLGLIGNDRQLDRGPTETDAAYALRLPAAFDTWDGAGNAFTILPLLAIVTSPNTVPPMRLVSNGSIWHTLSAGVVTKASGSGNWVWDSFTTRWWRGWAIIDSSGGPWTADQWNAATGLWGDGGTWGSDMTVAQGQYLYATLKRWKPINVLAQFIITFNADIFTLDGVGAWTRDIWGGGAELWGDGGLWGWEQPADADNPNGLIKSMNDAATRLTFNAIYSGDIS